MSHRLEINDIPLGLREAILLCLSIRSGAEIAKDDVLNELRQAGPDALSDEELGRAVEVVAAESGFRIIDPGALP